MSKMQDLIFRVEIWAEERNLIEGATPQKQYLKLMEELSEMSVSRMVGSTEEVKDGIGDSFVVLIILCSQLGFDFNCIWKMYENPEPHADRLGVVYLEYILYVTVGRMASELCRDIKSIEEIYIAVNYLRCLCEFLGHDPAECLQLAYDEIKDRKGKMIDGVFVKEEDLNAKSR